MSLAEQLRRTGDNVVQVLDGDLDRSLVVHLHGDRIIVGCGVVPNRGPPSVGKSLLRKPKDAA